MRIIKKIKTLPLSHYTVRIGLLLLACLLVGCQSSAETFALPASVISQPAGAAVHYRVIRKPFESLTEIKDEWIYLGRTPYEGKPGCHAWRCASMPACCCGCRCRATSRHTRHTPALTSIWSRG